MAFLCCRVLKSPNTHYVFQRRPHTLKAVSYTHLDVYKRQVHTYKTLTRV